MFKQLMYKVMIMLNQAKVMENEIRFKCPECGRKYFTAAKNAGKITDCMKCGAKFFIPEVKI
jgi:ribosomal protein L37AE/L43A